MAHLSTIKAEASRSAVGRVAGSQALVSFRLAVVSRDSTQPLLTHIYQASPRDWSDDYIKKKLFFNMEQGAILRVGKVSSPAITAIFENTPSINEKINIVYTFGVDTAALRGSEKCQVELTDLFFMPEQPVFTFATASLD